MRVISPRGSTKAQSRSQRYNQMAAICQSRSRIRVWEHKLEETCNILGTARWTLPSASESPMSSLQSKRSAGIAVKVLMKRFSKLELLLNYELKRKTSEKTSQTIDSSPLVWMLHNLIQTFLQITKLRIAEMAQETKSQIEMARIK